MNGDGDGLAEFIAARLAEDETKIREGLEHDGAVDHRYHCGPHGELLGAISLSMYHHHYRPRRALAELEMKRALARIHSPKPLVTQADRDSPAEPYGEWRKCQEHDWTLWPCGTVRLIAAIWSEHPEYRREWAP